ncbi:MAG: NAD-dependent epimerase/dehydratase family protein, partial [Elusimicrobia bacterium]|nr:NAD-dependent epimerase/dehydratase family protein [Elusimicrobiota bacterium]
MTSIQRAFVTGGTGFVGANVVRALLKAGVAVRALARPSSNRRSLEGLPVEVVEGDLLDALVLRKLVQGCDTVFHVAADYRLWVPDPAVMVATNVQGTDNVLRAASEAGVGRVVYTSSVAAVGRPLNGGMGDETIDPFPQQLIGPYKRSKFEAERVAHQWATQGLPVVIVNPSTPIGPYDVKPTPTGKMIVDFINRRMPAYVDTGLNFVDVDDVAVGHLLAAHKGRVGERYILGHQNLTLLEFCTVLSELTNLSRPRWKIPYPVAYAVGAMSTAIATITRQEPTVPLDGV